MSAVVRLALVGAGRWGRNYIAAAEKSGLARVRHLVSRGGVDIVLSRDDFDAVVVAVHPREAVGVACRALARGKPVLIEKPAGLSLREAQLLATVEETTGGLVLVGHQHLHSEGMGHLRRRAELDLAVAGDVTFGGPGLARDYSALWDYGPHAVSAALALLGGDATATRADERGAFTVVGDRGWLRCQVGADWPKKLARVIVHRSGTYDGYAPAEPALTRQVRAFARAVMDGGTFDCLFGAGWAVDVARLLEQAGGRPGYRVG